ncbi:hypothetical protein GcC1_118001 [Golovinomyces cichoracearum]|uniref:DUF7492 domain-containing protein n=1 Tax=Golovinomyces cichoracearum TaxID=62708 RepID=A0A420I7E5_9PEZI|nr:hypothetical protein GcC1_118001 [Golovinomyces cichoracearum]
MLAHIIIDISLLTIYTLAHTWVETVNLIAADGSIKDTGFMRGFGGRIQGVDPDKTNTYLLPPNGRGSRNEILPTDLMCKDTQVNRVQSEGFPRLSASPNDRISLAYHENGHVTKFALTDGKPSGRGTVFVYGTKSSLPTDTFLEIHRVWNTKGTGGDGRGKLLTTRPFDDGQCFQPNDEKLSKTRAKALGFSNPADSPEVLCQHVVKLPKDAGHYGIYTLYWVWEWPTLDKSGNIFKNESYTSCIDIKMIKNSATNSQGFKPKKESKHEKEETDDKASANTTDLESMTHDKSGNQDKNNSKNPITANRDDGKVFNTAGVKTEKNEKNKANIFAVQSQLQSEEQITVDPSMAPQIASDNPPTQAGSGSTAAINSSSSKTSYSSEKMAHISFMKMGHSVKRESILLNDLGSKPRMVDSSVTEDAAVLAHSKSYTSKMSPRSIRFPRRGLWGNFLSFSS